MKNKLKIPFDTKSFFRKYGIIFLLIVAIAFSAILSDDFFTIKNLFNILKQVSVVSILAFGECMLIIAGQIDLSAGAVVACSGVVSALVSNATGSLTVGIIACLLMGALVGLFNGVIVTRYNLPAFIVTLGAQIAIRGLALYLTSARAIVPELETYRILGQEYVFGVIPYLVLLVLFLAATVWFVMTHTSFGRYIYAIGGNEEAASAAGVRVKKVKTLAFTLSGLLAGIAGFSCMSRLNVAQPNVGATGVSYEFDAVIGVVMGGASFTGGTGSVVMAFLGCIFIGVLNNILNLMNVSAYMQQIVKGGLIIITVIVDAMNKGYGGGWILRRREKAKG